MKPLVKWAGGKTQLLPNLLPLIPEFNTYYEPFLGGGAVYFALKPKKAVLNDYNEQLVNVYIQCRDNPKLLKAKLDHLQTNHIDSSEHFNKIRAEYNTYLSVGKRDTDSAALLIYLNKAGFNGLYRLNSKGLFNTPYGKKKSVTLYNEENFDGASKLLKTAKIMSGDFEDACKGCKKGDFVFFDSPYYNTFDTYQAGGFSDHERLAELFRKLTKKGAKCLLTNSNEEYIKGLYAEYNIEVVDVKRMINCDGKNRKGQEIIVRNY